MDSRINSPVSSSLNVQLGNASVSTPTPSYDQERFARDGERAQADPDYSRKLSTEDVDKELFRPSLPGHNKKQRPRGTPGRGSSANSPAQSAATTPQKTFVSMQTTFNPLAGSNNSSTAALSSFNMGSPSIPRSPLSRVVHKSEALENGVNKPILLRKDQDGLINNGGSGGRNGVGVGSGYNSSVGAEGSQQEFQMRLQQQQRNFPKLTQQSHFSSPPPQNLTNSPSHLPLSSHHNQQPRSPAHLNSGIGEDHLRSKSTSATPPLHGTTPSNTATTSNIPLKLDSFQQSPMEHPKQHIQQQQRISQSQSNPPPPVPPQPHSSAQKPVRRHYNEGYKDRIKSLEKSPLFFRVPLNRDQTIRELQRIYSDITTLEPRCKAILDPANKPQLYDEDQWGEIAQTQIKLVEHYCDFLYYASTAIENGSTKGLVRKYRIPTRLWNFGISLFIDSLRESRPQFTSVLGRFVINCMNLLMLFVDPIYETRHVWIESLGDLAFVCLISDVKACADWPEMCMYWYQRRLLLTPGTGRVYRHMASICDIKIDKLFYICKSCTSWQPTVLDPNEVLSLLNIEIDTRKYYSDYDISANNSNSASLNSNRNSTLDYPYRTHSSITSLCLLHLQCMGIIKKDRFYVDRDLKNEIILSHKHTTDHGAAIAFCNIAALLGHGNPENPLFGLFQALYKKKKQKGSSSEIESSESSNANNSNYNAPTASNEEEVFVPNWADEKSITGISQLTIPRVLAFEILYAFLESHEWVPTLQHVIIWLYFFIALCENFPDAQEYYFSKFKPHLFALYLNHIIDISDDKRYFHDNSGQPYQGRRDSPNEAAPDSIAPEERLALLVSDLRLQVPNAEIADVPLLMDRALPEEYHIRGFVWSSALERYRYLFSETSIPDEPFVAAPSAHYLNEIRVKRILSLAIDLSKSCSWLVYDRSSQMFLTSDMANR